MRTHRPFLLLLVLFAVGVLAQQATLPVMEGSDESIHSTYVEVIRRENRLPDRASFRDNSTRQESGQPPLTYWLAAQVANLLNLPSTDDDALLDHLYTVRNSWLTPPDAWNRRDNLNHYLHGRDESAFNAPDIVTTNRVLRLTSLVYGVLAVIGAYGAAREVFCRPSWALTATAIFAFMPTMMHISAYLTNDIPAVAFATLCIWQTLRLLRAGASPGWLLLTGLLLALGALSKVSTLLIAPGVGVALLLDGWSRRRSFGRLLANGLLVGAPLLLLFAPWVAWGVANYGDPFGFMTHRNPYLSYDALLPLSAVMRMMPEIYLSYWAKFGLAKVYLHPLLYDAFNVIAVLSLAGFVLKIIPAPGGSLDSPPSLWGRGRRWGALAPQQALVLLAVTLVVFAGLVRWMQEIAIITGRLMYPAHAAIAIGVTAGLYGLARRFPLLARPLQLFAVGVLAVAGIILTPLALYDAYWTPPLLAREQLPPLQGSPVDYDHTIRLLGYAQDSPYLDSEWHTVTLCWEVLQAAGRPAAFSVKFVRDGVIVADRTSIHGLGHYPSSQWRPGDIFCDEVDVALDDPDVSDDPQPQPGTVYDILVVLLDAETRAVDWQAATPDGAPVEFPFVGQVISPAGNMANAINMRLSPSAIAFPGFARLGSYALADARGFPLARSPLPGETLRLHTLWSVDGATPNDWTLFVHLTGQDVALALADGKPRGGAYPTRAWQPGELILDSRDLTLPADLPPGDYSLQIGWYRADTGERIPAAQDGAPLPDNAATLVRFTVNQ